MAKILIVEDDPDVCRALAIRLRRSGYEVVTAGDGLGGMSAAVKERPDLAILDISMPAGNGFDLADRMQNHGTTAGVPFIFFTASSRPGLREQARKLGAAAFIEKPYEPAELLSSIERALEKSRPAILAPLASSDIRARDDRNIPAWSIR